VIRHGAAAKKATTGSFTWRWDGRDDNGSFVADGPYRAIVAARTAAGILAYEKNVYVGAFHLSYSADKLYRGQQVRVTIYNTEPLSGPVTLSIHQRATAPFTVTASNVSAARQIATVTMAKGGDAGPVTIIVTGTDVNGGVESGLFHKHVY
jgi:hypothetical protein